jgi:hypothetical protein
LLSVQDDRRLSPSQIDPELPDDSGLSDPCGAVKDHHLGFRQPRASKGVEKVLVDGLTTYERGGLGEHCTRARRHHFLPESSAQIVRRSTWQHELVFEQVTHHFMEYCHHRSEIVFSPPFGDDVGEVSKPHGAAMRHESR